MLCYRENRATSQAVRHKTLNSDYFTVHSKMSVAVFCFNLVLEDEISVLFRCQAEEALVIR